MAIPQQLAYSGDKKEFQFRDTFVMPLLARLGFGVVVNYHGTREFGRDVVFGDVDRFGHVVYYGMQIKYEASIGLAESHQLIQDAEQATHNAFHHPQTGRQEFISTFYVANAGDISEQARTNFFSTLPRRGIRDARLLDGNALLLLDRAAALNRSASIKERITGLLQEIRRNQNVIRALEPVLRRFVQDPEKNPYPMQRCRNTACGGYLNSPFPIPNLSIDLVDQYWESARMVNEIVESIGATMVAQLYRENRFQGLLPVFARTIAMGSVIDAASVALLNQLSGAPLSV
jgi:hypothetical protein